MKENTLQEGQLWGVQILRSKNGLGSTSVGMGLQAECESTKL